LIPLSISQAQNQQEPPNSEKLSKPSSQPDRSTQDSNPKQEQRGTKDSPLFIQMTPSPFTEDKAADATRISDEKTAERRHQELITSTYHGIYASAAQAVGLIITIFVMIVTATRQLRAYLHLSADDGLIADGHNGLDVSLTIKNVGKTPAFRLTYWMNVDCSVDHLRTAFPAGTFHPSPMYLSPDANINIGTTWDTTWAKDDLFNRGTDKSTVRVYIWGEVRYIDAFKIRRFVKFRFIINRHGSGLVYCHEGNDAD
jgi:hypothetical protein